MHELSIAMSLIDVASEEATARGVSVVALHLRLGPLSGVVKEALLGAYDLARENSALADAHLVIQEMPIIAWCPTCQSERQLESPQRLCCPVCNTPTPDVRGGRELELAGLEVIVIDPATHPQTSAESA
jgi:hydrogenase nickel incorporation protein HypA/HybF